MRDDQERRTRLSHLAWATYEGKRLASFRRAIGACLAIVGTPVVVLSQFAEPPVGRTLLVFGSMWLALVPPMVCLLWMERRNGRLTEDLRTMVDAGGDGP